MLHPIGRKQQGEGLLDLLLGCHSRIRSFMALAVAIGERAELAGDEAAESAARVRRYFSQALPLHVEDEEESVLPRLMGRSPALDAALETMRAEHGEHAGPLRRLLAGVTAITEEPRSIGARSDTLVAARELLVRFEPHLAAEERIIFPALAELDAEEQAAMVRELRGRRRAT